MSEKRIRDVLEDLPNKPLVEAIFELRWSLKSVAPGAHQDPGWKNLALKYFGSVQGEYPEPVDLPASQIPEPLAGYMVRHQFRTAPGKWPLIQIGPGILTVNHSEGYTVWDDFHPRIRRALEVLSDVYTSENGPLEPIRAELRYINAVPFDSQELTPDIFLKKRLHTTVDIQARLFDGEEEVTRPNELNLNLSMPLKKPPGTGSLSFALGKKNDHPSIIWQLAIRSEKDEAPRDIRSFGSWLTDAHRIIERWFISLSEGELLKSFKETDNAQQHD